MTKRVVSVRGYAFLVTLGVPGGVNLLIEILAGFVSERLERWSKFESVEVERC